MYTRNIFFIFQRFFLKKYICITRLKQAVHKCSLLRKNGCVCIYGTTKVYMGRLKQINIESFRPTIFHFPCCIFRTMSRMTNFPSFKAPGLITLALPTVHSPKIRGYDLDV